MKRLISLAKLYCHPNEKDHGILTKYQKLKSGFTPTILRRNTGSKERVRHKLLMEYGRWRFRDEILPLFLLFNYGLLVLILKQDLLQKSCTH